MTAHPVYARSHAVEIDVRIVRAEGPIRRL
jgi:hypothetical protein